LDSFFGSKICCFRQIFETPVDYLSSVYYGVVILKMKSLLVDEIKNFPTTVSLNHIFKEDGIEASLYDEARGGLSVALERKKELDPLLDADMREEKNLNELSERAHQTCLIVIPCTTSHVQGYAQLILVNLDGDLRIASKGVYLTKESARVGSTESTVDDSIPPINFAYILVPERMRDFIDLIKTENHYKIIPVPSDFSAITYNQTVIKISVPNYRDELQSILQSDGEIFTHVLRHSTHQEINSEKK
jgi:hypothetical protein